MTLKLSDTAVIFDSGGDTVLVCDSFDYTQLIISGADSDNALPSDYVSNYFGFTVGTHNGFTMGGWTPGQKDEIDKFYFSTEADADDIADLSVARYGAAGTFSGTHGYAAGGQGGPLASELNVIDKFPFSSEDDATDVGNLTDGRWNAAGHQSNTHGYTSGGGQGAYNEGYSYTNIIDKFPFAVATANATDVGDLIDVIQGAAGQSSFTDAYRSGGIQSGYPYGPTFKFVNEIDKFPFATDTNATDTGDLQEANKNTTGFSSNVSGYTAGGNLSPSSTNYTNRIQKFPFSSAFTTAADVADLALARGNLTGTQA